MYAALAPDGNYVVTARERMFVLVEECGRWSRKGSRIVFIPKMLGASAYNAEEVSYKCRIFLAVEGDAGPGIPVPIAESNQSLDQNPKELSLYVVFEISGTVYEQETNQTYSFHSRANVR